MDPQQDEEVQLVTTLSSLEGTTSRHITELFGSSLDDRAAFNARSTRIREDLAALRAATRDLAILAEEQDTEEQSSRLAELLKGHQAEYENLQTAFKQANIQARRNTEAAAAEARKAMLAGGQAHSVPARAAGQADAVAASQGITKSLLRTRQLMAQELEHTSATLAAMDASNERLAEGREELRGHRGLFSGSRQLLQALFRSSILDTVSLYGGLAIFFLVVAYILQKRTLYFAPIGKVMAPVAGTAWSASRSAAQRAGQLPSAVLALHRRLNAKGHGALLLVDDELPASVDRVLQDDPTGDSHLEEAWKQQPTSHNDQQGAGAGSGSASDAAMLQQAAAQPDPLADIPAAPDDTVAPVQPAEEQPALGTDPAMSDAAEPSSRPGAAVTHDALGDVPEPPPAAADVAGAGDAGSASPAAAPAAGVLDAHEQPVTADATGKPADASAAVQSPANTAVSDAAASPADEDDPEGEARALRPDDPLHTPAAGGAAVEPTADDPAPAAPDDKVQQPDAAADALTAAAAGTPPAGGASAGESSSGTGRLGLKSQQAGGQPDETGPDGGSAGRSPRAAQEAAPDDAADAVPAVAPQAEPAADQPAATGAEAGGTVEPSGKEQDVPPILATGMNTNLDLPDRQRPDTHVSAGGQADASEQPPAPPAEGQAPIQAEDDGVEAAAQPSDSEASVPGSKDATDTPAGKPVDQPGQLAVQLASRPAAALQGTSQAAEPDMGAAQHASGDAEADIKIDQPAAGLQPEPPQPEAVEGDAAAGDGASAAESASATRVQDDGTVSAQQPAVEPITAGEAGSKEELPPAADMGVADVPPSTGTQQGQPAEPVSPDIQPVAAEPAPEVEAAHALPADTVVLPDSFYAAGAPGSTGDAVKHQEGADGMRPVDEEQTPTEDKPAAAATPTSVENTIYDEQGNKFEWRWHPEAGTAGRWKLYAAGTDTLVHEQPDGQATASPKGPASPEAVPVAQPEAVLTAQAPVQEQPAPAAEVVHDEL